MFVDPHAKVFATARGTSGLAVAPVPGPRHDVKIDKKSWPAADDQISHAEWMAMQAGKIYKYPDVRRSSSKYQKHGFTVPDPYDWLEDPNSVETKLFVSKQNKVFNRYLSDVKDKPKLRDSIEKMQNYARTGAPSQRHGKYYFWHNSGLQNQPVLYRCNTLDTKQWGEFESPKVFLDPNTLSKDGTTAVSSTAWSHSERFWAYSTTEKGSDWNKIHVMSAKGDELVDVIQWVKFSGISWLGDEGFFYTRYPQPEDGDATSTTELKDCALYFHKLGETQEKDVKVLQLPEMPKWLIGSEVSDDMKYLIITIHDGCEPHNLFWIAELPENFAANAEHPLLLKKLVDEWVGAFDYVGNDGTTFYLQTTHEAPLKKIVSGDVAADGNFLELKVDLVSERASKLDFCGLVRDTLLLVYLEDVKHVVYSRTIGGTAPMEKLAGVPIGTMSALSCRRECDFISFKMTSFLLPGRSFTTNVADLAGGLHPWRDDKVEGFNPDDFEAKQVFFESGDAKIPMFICSKKGISLDGQNPTLLYGYGGFNISVTPSFSASRIVFLRHYGGVLAVANIRGGGEYGEKWHAAGAKFNKQNCYMDFVKAAEYLIAQNYCSSKSLGIMGGSNGGLLVAATANRAPHLFGAVVCQVGVLDMYKFHQFTIGHAWKSDFGDPDMEADFKYLTEYSPIHNIRTGVQYPKVMVATADHDDRVVPAHSHKYIAALQHANPENSVFVARIDVSAGHGHGKPTSKIIDEAADTYAFLTKALGAKWRD